MYRRGGTDFVAQIWRKFLIAGYAVTKSTILVQALSSAELDYGLSNNPGIFPLGGGKRQKLFEPAELQWAKPTRSEAASFFGAAGKWKNAWDFA